MHNSKSLLQSLKLLQPNKLKSVAKSFIINDMLETKPKVIASVLNKHDFGISESLAEPFVSDEAFLFEFRVAKILARKFQKFNHHKF